MSSRRPEDVKMPRLALYTERGLCWDYLWTENYLFSLFCMTNYFVWRTPSSRFCRRWSYKAPIVFRNAAHWCDGAFTHGRAWIDILQSLQWNCLETWWTSKQLTDNICAAIYIDDALKVCKSFVLRFTFFCFAFSTLLSDTKSNQVLYTMLCFYLTVSFQLL